MKFGSFLLSIDKDYFYIMHLSYDGDEKERLWNYARSNNIIGLSHRDINDNWAKVREKAKHIIGKNWVRQFDAFCGMQKGDVIMVFNGMDSVLGIARTIESQHEYDKSFEDVFFDHIRHVEWIRKYEYANRKHLANLLLGFSNTLSKVTPSSPRWNTLTKLDF